MHADTIQAHQALTHAARDLVYGAWAGTEPMTREEHVRQALEDASPGEDPARLAALLPYVVDACREAGLLVVPAQPTTRARIVARLARYSADTADALAYVAAREARRRVEAGAERVRVLALSNAALEELRKLLGGKPSAAQCSAVRDVVALYLSDPAELARV